MSQKETKDLADNGDIQLILNKPIQEGIFVVEEEYVEEVNICETTAPDGGLRTWLIMLASFICNGIIFGTINSYGILFPEILSNLENAGVSEASSKAALVGSLALGITMALSSVASIVSDRIGIRRTTLIGSGLATMGLFCSSFLTNTVEALYVTYGVMYGLGAAMVLMPSIDILNHYFQKYLGLVHGIVAAGNSIFTIVMPFVVEKILKLTNLQKTMCTLAALAACMIFCSILFKPLPSRIKPKKKQLTFRGLINVSIWKHQRYLFWVTATTTAAMGYFVPYVHMKKFVDETFPGHDGKLPIMCTGITSCLGRLIFGYVADLPKVSRILLQQTSFLIIGIGIMCLPFCPTFVWLLVAILVMGLFDGCSCALFGPNAFDICGPDGASQALGFLFGIASITVVLGPPVAGMLYDHTKSYQLCMVFGGIPFILGFLIMFFVRLKT